MQALKDAIDDPNSSVGMEEARLIAPSLLVFDDLGSEKSTEWAREKIFTIFEARARQGKHTFFTTNLDPKDIRSVYKERIHDRMIEFCSWVQFPGKSFRKRNFKAEI
jgi:DNA replication protein DnaC